MTAIRMDEPVRTGGEPQKAVGARRSGGSRNAARRALEVLPALLVTLVLSAGSVFGQTPEELVERARAAGADAALLAELRSRAAARGIEGDVMAAMLTPPVALAEDGLPSASLIQKGLEGLAKGVPPDRIAAVLQRMREAIDRAGALAGPWLERADVRAVLDPAATGEGPGGARAALIEGIGGALFRGAPEPAVRALLDRVPRELPGRPVSARDLAVAAEVLPDLPLAGSEPEVAAELVLEAVRSGFGPAELRELPAALRAAERQGRLPADAVARGALAQMRGDIPAVTVLQNLFSGEFPGNVPFDLPPGLEDARGKGKAPPP